MAAHASVLVSLGLAVRAARTGRGLSLRTLASRIEVSPATLSAIENGRTRVTVERLSAIAEVLDVSVQCLLAGQVGEDPELYDEGDGPTGDWRTFPPLALDPVLEAGLRAFVDKGFHAASMRDVAAEAGLSVAGLYHHYPGKSALLVRLFELGMAELRWRVLAAREEGETERDAFARMVEALALFHALRADLAFLGASEMRGLPSVDRDRMTRLRNEIQRFFDNQLRRAIRAGEVGVQDPHTASRAVATMCTALPSWFRPGGALSAAEVARRYADLAVRMVEG